MYCWWAVVDQLFVISIFCTRCGEGESWNGDGKIVMAQCSSVIANGEWRNDGGSLQVKGYVICIYLFLRSRYHR